MSVKTKARSSRTSTSRKGKIIYQVQTLIMEDHRVTIQKFDDKVGIYTSGFVYFILREDLSKRRFSAKIALKLLTMEKKICMKVQQYMLEYVNRDPNNSFIFTDVTRKPSFVNHCGNIRHHRGQKTSTVGEQEG